MKYVLAALIGCLAGLSVLPILLIVSLYDLRNVSEISIRGVVESIDREKRSIRVVAESQYPEYDKLPVIVTYSDTKVDTLMDRVENGTLLSQVVRPGAVSDITINDHVIVRASVGASTLTARAIMRNEKI